MSSLFSSGRRADGRDPELAEGTRRRERAFARDIGDERALARDDQPRYRRPRLWLLVAILAVLVIGGYRAVRHTSGPQISKSCSTAALAMANTTVSHGDSVEWSGTGPTAGRYALVLDGTPTQVDSDNRVSVAGGTALSGSFTMSGCLVHSAFDAPKSTGTHTLRLFHRTNGAFQLVARLTIRVV